MQFDSRTQTAELGIVRTRWFVSKHLGWIFREQLIHDRGIDAHVEICRDGKATGRLIGVQIKSGASYFRNLNEQGAIFRDASDHLSYWVGHSLPVVLVLYNPDTNQGWWEQVSEQTVQRTDNGFQLIVPRMNMLDRSVSHRWIELAGETTSKLETVDSLVLRFHSKPNERITVLHDAIAIAERSLYLASPSLSADILAILQFLSRRVKIRVIVGAIPQSLTAKTLGNLRSNQFELLIRPDVHFKLIIVDQSIAFISTLNLTSTAWSTPSLEVMHVETHPATVHSHANAFRYFWSQSQLVALNCE